MIARSAPRRPRRAWQRLLADAIYDPAVLLRGAGVAGAPAAGRPASGGAVSAARAGAVSERIRPAMPPIPCYARCCRWTPNARTRPGYTATRSARAAAQPRAGLLHKYPGRALLIATAACAVHCRYCFRRHFPYGEGPAGGRLAPAIDRHRGRCEHRRGHPERRRSADADDDRAAGRLAAALAAIPHLHTPAHPLADCRWCCPSGSRRPARPAAPAAAARPCWCCTPTTRRRSTPRSRDALRGTRARAGVTLLNQAVLLRGVNDDAETLVTLSERLIAPACCRTTCTSWTACRGPRISRSSPTHARGADGGPTRAPAWIPGPAAGAGDSRRRRQDGCCVTSASPAAR